MPSIKVGKNTRISLSFSQIITLMTATVAVVSGYFDIKSDISDLKIQVEKAMTLPLPPVTRMEYDMRREVLEHELEDINDKLEEGI